MLLKKGEESSCLYCSTANAQVVPVWYLSISITVALIFVKEPPF